MLSFLSVAGGFLAFASTIGTIITYEALRYPVVKTLKKYNISVETITAYRAAAARRAAKEESENGEVE